jgi:membrane glycosyltransferase
MEKKNTPRGYLFVFSAFILTFIITYIMAGMIVFEEGNILFPSLWLMGFCVLVYNVCLALTQAVFYFFLRENILPEANLSVNPMTAVVYPVKDETFGLYERIKYTIENNKRENIHYWILSDSKGRVLEYEEDILRKLGDEFHDVVIKYRNRRDPVEKKQGNISDWIREHGKHYKYMVVCDADSVLPSGTCQKLINKAEHPDNADVAIFQGGIRVIHAKTFFSRFIALATESSQKFNVTVVWRIFGRSMSVGHGNLIRIEPFSKVQLKKGVICHDIWETAYLDQMGYRTCFCEDIVSYEEVPGNYLEARNRDSRWAKGTLQAWQLPFLPGISLSTRYHIGYCIYSYIAHILLLVWMVSGFFCASQIGGQLLSFQRYAFVGYSMIDLELSSMLIGSLLIMAFHKLVACRTFRDVTNLLSEVLFSTLVALNNVFYVSMDLITMPFSKFNWKPMKKNPLEGITIYETVKTLLPGTIFGLVCIYLGIKYSVHWLMISSPFIISFVGAIPIVYLTAMRSE